MPPKRKTVVTRKVKGAGPKLEKFKEGAKKVWKYVKDKKLISKGLAAVSPFLGPKLGLLTKGASTIVSSLGAGKGAGLSLPGGGKNSHPYRSCCRCGLGSRSFGSGLLLAGQKANHNNIPRPRIVKPDCYEVVGSGVRIIGNKLY